MPTLNIKDVPESKIVKLMDLSEDSINKIAEAVAQKIAEPVKHGYWRGKPIAGYSTVGCSNCGDVFLENSGRWNYCPTCGAKMDGAK